jgi:hypothetical protein
LVRCYTRPLPQAVLTLSIDYAEDQMKLSEGAVVDIVRAEPLSGYKLKLYFSDGIERAIDFEPFLRRSKNPMIRLYLDPKRFANFTVKDGDLMWDDYGLCFPLADLYENNI